MAQPTEVNTQVTDAVEPQGGSAPTPQPKKRAR